jgi:uncharacterized protein (TIGR02145 family)
MIDNAKKPLTIADGCSFNSVDMTNFNGVDYGYYYSWNCAEQACPTGWSLPTDADFTALEAALTAEGNSAWEDWNSGSSLAGYGYNGSYHGVQGSGGYWWIGSSNRNWYVGSGSTSGIFNDSHSNASFSVRCRKSQ